MLKGLEGNQNRGIYTVVVVEDEPKISRNIIKKIEQSDPMFQVIGSAQNGIEALSMIHSLQPDVIFTDIRMPQMDGLELIKQVKNQYTDKQIIILSGYNEFEYAQQAIKLGVTDYLLKPVEVKSLIEVLGAIKSSLDINIRSIERKMISSDIQGLNYPSVSSDLFEDSRFSVFLIGIGTLCGPMASNTLRSFYNKLWDDIPWTSVLSHVLNTNDEWWILDEQQPNHKFLIILSSDPSHNHTAEQALQLLNNLSELTEPYIVNICTDEQLNSYTELYNVAQKLRITFEQGFIMRKSTIITPNILKIIGQLPPLFDAVAQKRLAIIIQSNDKGLLQQELKQLFNKWEQMQYPQRMLEKGLCQFIRQCCLQTAFITELEVNHIEYELNEKLSNSPDLQSIFEFTIRIFDNILVTDKKDMDNVEDLVNRIKEYINSHFTEDISLSDISKKFNFSVPYITKVFKRYSGETFLQYLISLRINEAKRLIESQAETDIKKIGELVGYSDQHYFSRIFRNVTGMSPSEYKTRIVVQ